MTHEPQTFSAPDGTEMVILPASEFARLKLLAEEVEDVAEAHRVLARIEAGEGTMPGEVLNLILDDGLHPIAAWRRYRGLSQAALARKARLSQVWISRLECGGGYGSRATRRRLAEALDAPDWALDTDEADASVSRSSGRNRKYGPLHDYLRSSGKAAVTMSFNEIGKLVGGLPPSATNHRPWWGNHQGHSQAKAWMDAGYAAEPDVPRRRVTFHRRG